MQAQSRWLGMRYIDESLAPGETIIRRGKWPTLFWVGAWAALLLLGIILVGVFIFVGMAIKMLTTDFCRHKPAGDSQRGLVEPAHP